MIDFMKGSVGDKSLQWIVYLAVNYPLEELVVGKYLIRINLEPNVSVYRNHEELISRF